MTAEAATEMRRCEDTWCNAAWLQYRQEMRVSDRRLMELVGSSPLIACPVVCQRYEQSSRAQSRASPVVCLLSCIAGEMGCLCVSS